MISIKAQAYFFMRYNCQQVMFDCKWDVQRLISLNMGTTTSGSMKLFGDDWILSHNQMLNLIGVGLIPGASPRLKKVTQITFQELSHKARLCMKSCKIATSIPLHLVTMPTSLT